MEVCNWTASAIEFEDDYWLRFNGLSSDRFNGRLASGACFVAWYELSGAAFRPSQYGGTVDLMNIDLMEPVDTYTYPAPPSNLCIGRWPDGSDTWAWLRCSPGRSNGYWLVNPTPTPTVTP